MKSFEGRVIAITGAGSGMGRTTALVLASRHARLSLADVNQAGLQKVADEIELMYKVKPLTYQLDVRDPSAVHDWITQTVQQFGQLDGAANLAGVIPKSIGLKTLAEQDLEEWDFIMGVNLTGVMLCLKEQLQVISDGGSIVNASSIAGLMGRKKSAAYAASKHGVLGLTRSAAKEFGGKQIRVNAVCPGSIDTPMVQQALAIAGHGSEAASSADASLAQTTALGRRGQPEEVSALIAFLLSSESSYMTGQAVTIDGGWVC